MHITKYNYEKVIRVLKAYQGCQDSVNALAYTPGRRQSKTSILPTNVDQKSLETEFLIAICRPIGDKCQSKTLFLAIFDPRSSIVKSVFDCRLLGVEYVKDNWYASCR